MGLFKRNSDPDPGSGAFEQRMNQGAAADRQDYLSVGGADDFAKAENDAVHTSNQIQAQRQANRVFGNPPASQGDDTERRNAGNGS
jgi:hypothetical protein